jgi:quinol monooxygenase YgiN
VTFGLVMRFELKNAAAAEAFDRLVAETTEHIRAAEPGTLMYVTNRVEDAQLSRIFYEIYTDPPAGRMRPSDDEVAARLLEMDTKRHSREFGRFGPDDQLNSSIQVGGRCGCR